MAVNLDRKETIGLSGHIWTGSTFWELSLNVLFGNLLTYYMLKNVGDRITFINDRQEVFTLFGRQYSWEDFDEYRDVTEELVDELIKAGMYRDEGIEWIDQDEDLYFRKLVNVADPACGRDVGSIELPPVPVAWYHSE